jgi:hypothetical protein
MKNWNHYYRSGFLKERARIPEGILGVGNLMSGRHLNIALVEGSN